jgi:transcriptional regulator with XRE-family HTH domain
MDSEGAQRLATWVRARRGELGLTRQGVLDRARDAGHKMALATLQAIEDGQRDQLQARTREALAAGLGSTPDTIRQVLAGVIPPPAATTEQGNIARLAAEFAEAVAQQRDSELSGTDHVVAVLRLLSDDQRECVYSAVDRLRVRVIVLPEHESTRTRG